MLGPQPGGTSLRHSVNGIDPDAGPGCYIVAARKQVPKISTIWNVARDSRMMWSSSKKRKANSALLQQVTAIDSMR